MNELKSYRSTDLDHLSRLKALSWLSPAELNLLVSALTLTNFKRRSIILHETGLIAQAYGHNGGQDADSVGDVHVFVVTRPRNQKMDTVYCRSF